MMQTRFLTNSKYTLKPLTRLIVLGMFLITGIFSNAHAQSGNLTVAEALAQRNPKLNSASTKSEKQTDSDTVGTIKKASVANIESTASTETDTTGVANETANEFYQDPTLADKTSDNDYLTLWIKLILIMGVFSGAGYYILRYLKKRNQNQQTSDSKLFSPIAEFAFGMNKKVQIIKILNDYYVLAVGQDEVNLLTKVEDKESIDLLALEGNKKPVGNFFEDSFKNYLNVGSWSPASMTKALKNKVRGL